MWQYPPPPAPQVAMSSTRKGSHGGDTGEGSMKISPHLWPFPSLKIFPACSPALLALSPSLSVNFHVDLLLIISPIQTFSAASSVCSTSLSILVPPTLAPKESFLGARNATTTF
ncbi:hypothetical protein GOP47_0029543 [Adiantum capillus-veneris]|nr:hypothetical protein GOP47_0029543 [Adiantum capillus-veneris]